MTNDSPSGAAPDSPVPPAPGAPTPYPGAPGYAAPGTPNAAPPTAAYAAPPAAYSNGGAYPAAPGYAPYGGYAPPAPTNGLAVASMIAGIAGWVLIPLLASIAAVIMGHVALGQLRRQPAGGRGMAITGLVLGYTAIGLTALILFFVFVVWGIAAFSYRS